MRRIAVVIPAWNEPEALAPLLAEIPPGVVDDVVVVVPDAADPGAEVARASGARWLVQPRRGYGAACLAGAESAIAYGADLIVFLDGDYSDPPAALPAVLEPLLNGRADLVLGSRNLSRYPGAMPWHARLGNAVALGAIRWLLRIGHFRDLPSFKAVRADALQSLQMQERTYGWTVEMLVKAERAGLRTEEVAVHYRPRLGGRSKVSGTVRGTIGAAWKLFSCAARYAFWEPSARRLANGAEVR